MPKTKITRSPEQRQALKTLKKAGLYSGDLRKPPTRYAKSLISKFTAFLSGGQKIVTVKSRSAAKQLAGQTGLSKGRKVLIDAPKDAKISYSRAKNAINIKVDGEKLIRNVGALSDAKTYYLMTRNGLIRMGNAGDVESKVAYYVKESKDYIMDNLYEGFGEEEYFE